MSTEIWIAAIGVATAASSGVISWLVTRKEHNAQASLLGIDTLKSIREFYESALQAINRTVDTYRKQQIINEEEIRDLKLLLSKLLFSSCIKKDCMNREQYSSEEIDNILEKAKMNYDWVNESLKEKSDYETHASDTQYRRDQYGQTVPEGDIMNAEQGECN